MNNATFSTRKRDAWSYQIGIEVSSGGEPFGLIWTYPDTATESHPWHAKPLEGKHVTFATLDAAKTYMAGLVALKGLRDELEPTVVALETEIKGRNQ